MEKTRYEADKLLSDGYFKHAINGYVEYLQQVIITAVVKYYSACNTARAKELQDIFATKKQKNVTLNYIINLLPRKLRTNAIEQNCKYVRNVRNDISAHPYYVVSMRRLTGGRYECNDVNTKRKYIRRIRKHAHSKRAISKSEEFLRIGNPITIYSRSDQLMECCESFILEDIAKNVKNRIQQIKKALMHELEVQTSVNCTIDYWIDNPE